MDIDSLKFYPAKFFLKGRTHPIDLIVVHDAEDLGEYGKHPDYTSSWHISVDNDSAERSVLDEDTAYAAPPVNSHALHIELAGRGNQTRVNWLDAYSTSTIINAAKLVAQWCLKHNIPVRQLTNEQLARGEKGIVGHYQVSAVWKKSDHTDPGANFPWDVFMAEVVKASSCH
jgi:hypothetical protein